MKSRASVLFRADASTRIGTGHVSRCLTLADELAHRGWSIAFAAKPLPRFVAGSIGERGYRLVEFPAELEPMREWRVISQQFDVPPTVVIADHYELDIGWERGARSLARSVVVIDDLADRPHDADVLLNQNLGAGQADYEGKVSDGCVLLLGPAFALLRKEFESARRALPPRTGSIERLFVFLSGADEHDATGTAVRALRAMDGIAVDVVCGPAYQHLDELRAALRGAGHVNLHVNTERIADLMANADLAIGAPSSASWERCSLGLPTILVVLADNQVAVNGELVRAGAAMTLGWCHEVDETAIASAVELLRADPARVRRMSAAAQGLVDGGGTSRVADAIERIAWQG